MQTVDHLLDRVARAVDLAPRRRPDHQLADKRKREQHGRDCVGQVRRGGVKIAAERRSGDRPDLPRDRAQGDRPGEDLARHEVGRERLKRWHCERACDPQQSGDAEQFRQGDRIAPG